MCIYVNDGAVGACVWKSYQGVTGGLDHSGADGRPLAVMSTMGITIHLSESLLRGWAISLCGQLAGSMPQTHTHTHLPHSLSTQTHTQQSTGTGQDFSIHQQTEELKICSLSGLSFTAQDTTEVMRPFEIYYFQFWGLVQHP